MNTGPDCLIHCCAGVWNVSGPWRSKRSTPRKRRHRGVRRRRRKEGVRRRRRLRSRIEVRRGMRLESDNVVVLFF